MGVFLSGGLDSSAVTALLCAAAGQERVQAFSFRCQGESYDESAFAALVADACGCRRHLVEYTPERVREMGRIAAEMDEPFCDIGINIATWILAEEVARQGVALVLTGDGGDELYCGHPVYPADRLARRLERPAGGLARILARPLTRLSDAPAKKSLKVKLKRFAQGLVHPADLGPSRWRFHSVPEEVELLLAPAAPRGRGVDPYAGVRTALAGAAAGVDVDARRVLADYRIVVEFYLRRLILARRFGIEARAPWLDHRLVELAAALPSAWRTTGLKDEKVLMKRVVEPWLPHEVVYRKDKLGHSVPFKNWLRDSPPVRGLVEEALGGTGLARRDLVDPGRVSALRAAHGSGRENVSHRLWALSVLELWLRGNFS
jgi:asparagine synthase (glutamine-hydrolysing)